MSFTALPSELLAFIHELSYGDVPPAVVAQARRCVVDLIAVHLGGLRTACARSSRAFARTALGATDGAAASLWFDGERIGPPGAAYVNAMTIDALDMHPGYRPAKGHAGVAVLPAALATAEAFGRVSGSELATALCIGYELALRCGRALHASTPAYHSSGAWSAIGCAAAASRLWGLDGAQTAHALGIAEYYAPRAPMMRLIRFPSNLKDSSGWGALAGVSASLLARAGLTGAPAELLCDRESSDFAQLGTRWELLELYFKPHACCRWAQPAIDAALALRAEHAIEPAAITRVDVHSFDEAVALHIRRPADTDQAQYSLPFSLAAALQRGRVSADEVTGGALVDPRVLGLADRIAMHHDAFAQAKFPLERHARVEIQLSDGRCFDSGYHTAHGDPDKPYADHEIQTKLETHAAGLLDAARTRRLAELGWSFDELDELRPLFDVLHPPARAIGGTIGRMEQQAHEVRVSALMSRELITLEREQSLPLAKELMRLKRVRHLPVVDHEGRLVGLVTHRDLLEAQVSALASLSDSDREELQLAVPVSRIMREQVWTVTPDTYALEAARIMRDHRYGCLPVVDDERLVGILTEADFLDLTLAVLDRDRARKARPQVVEKP